MINHEGVKSLIGGYLMAIAEEVQRLVTEESEEAEKRLLELENVLYELQGDFKC